MNAMKLITISALTLAMVLCFASPVSAVGEFSIKFEKSPLFSEANFTPGDSVTRFVRATNNISDTAQAVIFVSDLIDPDGLADVLRVMITESGIVRYTGSLHDFSDAGQINLPDVPGNTTSTFYVSVTLNSQTGDNHQGAALYFDLSFGMRSEGEQEYQTFGSSSGGGAVILPGYLNTPTPTQSSAIPTLTPTFHKQSVPGANKQSGVGDNTSFDLMETGEVPSTNPSSLAVDSSSGVNNLLASIGSFFGDVPSWIWWLILFILGLSFVFWLIRRLRRKNRQGQGI